MLRTSKVGDLIPIINERMRFPTGTNVNLYEVRKSHLTSDKCGFADRYI